jgi:predicted porin
MAQVTLSGRASIDMSTWQAVNSTAGSASDLASRTRVADNGSRITFSANEDLGGGMKAGLYCETGINVDNAERTGQTGTTNANTQTWCSREGRAYFGNNLVEARLGRQNVFWTSGAPDATGSNLGGHSISANMYGGGVGLYGTRLENMIKLVAGSEAGAFAGSELYTGFMQSPVDAGSLAGTFDYQVATQTGESAAAGVSGGGYNGFKLTYNSGPMNLMVDYQSYTKSASVAGVTSAGVSSVIKNSFSGNATKYQLGYALGGESIVSIQYWTKSRTDETAPTAAFSNAATGTAGNGTDSGWVVNYNHDFKNSFVGYAQYGKANNITGGPNGTEQVGTDATAYTVGALKRFSKRTHLFASYHTIANGANINYSTTGGGYASRSVAPNGSTVTVTALGMIHNF